MPTQKIVAPPAKAAMFLVLTVNDGAEAEVADVLTEVSDLTKAVSFRVPASDLLCVVGVGHDAWSRLFDAPLPKDLHPFKEFHGDVHSAQATPGDILIHLRAGTQDVCFELAKHLMKRLGPHVHVEDEVHGFKFFEERDLLGFVDGTANPEGRTPAPPPWWGMRIPTTAAAATCWCRSTCTTCRRGKPSRWRSSSA